MLKATVTIVYDGEVKLFLRVLFIKIRLVPPKKKKYPHSMSAKKARKIKEKLHKKQEKKLAKKAAKKKQKEEQKKLADNKESKKPKKTPRDILDIISLVANLIAKVISRFFGHLKIKLMRIRIKVATGDAASTAIAYGAITQAINVFFPLIENIKTVRLPVAKEIDINPDFCSDECEIEVKISFSLRVWHLFHVLFVALGEFIKYLFKSMKRKNERESAQ